jgi:hypothetical protein
MEFLFLLPAGSSRVIQAFENNAFLAVTASGTVFEGSRVAVGPGVRTWVIINQPDENQTASVAVTSPPVSPATRDTSPATNQPVTNARIVVKTTRHSNRGNPFSISMAVLYAIGSCFTIWYGLQRYKDFLRERRVIELRLNPPKASKMRRRG